MALQAKQETVVETPLQQERPAHNEMLFYGMGFFGIILIWTMVGTFLTFYYTDVAGISAGVVGTLMLVARLLDGFTDVGMGALVDRTKSKYGKARPWILWMAIPFAVSGVLLFSVPDLSTNGKIVYAYVTYFLLILMYTAISIPYKTLLGLMTQDQKGRTLVNVYTGVFTMLATILVMTLAQPIASSIGGNLGWTVVAIAIGVIIIVNCLLAFRKTKERVDIETVAQSKEKIPFKTEFKALLSNKYWVIITLYCVIAYTLNALLSGAGIFYAQYILGSAGYFSLIALTLFLPTIVGFFFVGRLIARFGKRNIAIFVTCVAAFGSVIKLIDPNNLSIFLIGNAVQGFALLPIITFLYAMINDTTEYGEWKSGFRTAGLVNSAASFGMKVGAGIGGALIGWLLAFGGYVGSLAEQSASAEMMIITLNIYLPLLLTILQLLFLWMYKLDKLYPNIVAEINERKALK
ncbi:MFS transporter [Alkalihalobacterium chitinilyticum]|uniref:Glycoside-pentoside-hexuronide (GPH):cation symporter n=1 Tax=Alkalihalobacterium chitinilyticum TaxID=2980103 RepID=A0ABT5VI69_9BACI|nr:glycoside-pentoside-hexuronide (GPH):cation symporter [Alkalihalobacterium chitinilyticum]MDE5415145.1 glycoside-pentoside-hexuronide (GPH):cation symporter [Alkalihalobacterium chitinilyticum]